MLGSNNTLTTYRFDSDDSDGHTNYSSTPTLTTEACYIERMALQQATLLDAGNPLEVYEAVFGRIVDLKENDQCTDKNGKVYRVNAVQRVEDFIEFTKAIITGVIA